MKKIIIAGILILLSIGMVSANNLLDSITDHFSYNESVPCDQSAYSLANNIAGRSNQTNNAEVCWNYCIDGYCRYNHFGSAYASHDSPAELSAVYDGEFSINIWISTAGGGAPARFLFWSDRFDMVMYDTPPGYISMNDGVDSASLAYDSTPFWNPTWNDTGREFWHMLTITKADNTVGSYKLYIDSVLQNVTISPNASVVIDNVPWTGFTIGSAGGPWSLSPIMFDELTIADREWTQEDINDLYNSGNGLPFSEYSIEETTSTSAVRRGDYYYRDAEGNIYTREQIEGTTLINKSGTTFATVVPYGEPIKNPFKSIISWIKSFLSHIGITI